MVVAETMMSARRRQPGKPEWGTSEAAPEFAASSRSPTSTRTETRPDQPGALPPGTTTRNPASSTSPGQQHRQLPAERQDLHAPGLPGHARIRPRHRNRHHQRRPLRPRASQRRLNTCNRIEDRCGPGRQRVGSAAAAGLSKSPSAGRSRGSSFSRAPGAQSSTAQVVYGSCRIIYEVLIKAARWPAPAPCSALAGRLA